ncbi:MAG: TetR/AcrR family transcriptional regulator [Draconibacterium sp.]|nr:TetR/AcrR family transcriptional regulator [Draconibacterium sp.]
MGIKERKIREKENRRKEILETAEKLFSGKKGFDATMDDLALKTELGKGTLYLYFPNKKSILIALAEKGMGLLRKRLARAVDESKTGVEQLSDNGDTFVDFLNDKKVLRFTNFEIRKNDCNKSRNRYQKFIN